MLQKTYSIQIAKRCCILLDTFISDLEALENSLASLIKWFITNK